MVQLCSDHHRSNTHIQSLLVKLQEDAFQDEHPQEEHGGGDHGEHGGRGEHGGEIQIQVLIFFIFLGVFVLEGIFQKLYQQRVNLSVAAMVV